VTKKAETAKSLGLSSETIRLPATIEPDVLFTKVEELNRNPAVDGILIQRPVPLGIEDSLVIEAIDPLKDVDGFHPMSPHVSCTPAGIMEILKFYEIPVSGKVACVVGRSKIVGLPLAKLLLNADATLIQCHSKTQHLAHLTRTADILYVAAGRSKMITQDHVKPGATVIDVGIHRNSDGTICGDVDFDSAAQVASAITPVPGGVGPMTITMLLKNTITAATLRAKRS
jgi:methylenetetrahydrofolate dehydrogenase (NADP+)/methenyltetrahydrofolate cyclohydrolase